MTDVKKDAPVSTEDGGETIVPPADGSTVTPPASAPGENTDPALLLQSLHKEREKRREVEATLKDLQDALASGDGLSEEGKALKVQIDELQGKIATMTTEKTLSDLQTKFPALKDKISEFIEFRKDYPEGNDESVAKIFLAENDLLDAPAPRKGLERPSGGGRTVQPRGMTVAEADDLRKNDFRKYSKLLKEGKLNDLVD